MTSQIVIVIIQCGKIAILFNENFERIRKKCNQIIFSVIIIVIDSHKQTCTSVSSPN